MKKVSLPKVAVMIILLFIALCIFLYSLYKNQTYKPTKAILQVDGETVAEFCLSDYKTPTIIPLDQYGLHGKIEITNTAVRFVEMDCPDKICVNTSWISKVTQSSACLPNKAYLTVS